MITLLTGQAPIFETALVSRVPGKVTKAEAEGRGSLPEAFASMAFPRRLQELGVRYRSYEMAWGNFRPPDGIGVGTFDSVARFELDPDEAHRIRAKLTGRTELLDGRTFRTFSATTGQPGPHFVRFEGSRLVVACMRPAARASLLPDWPPSIAKETSGSDAFVLVRRTSENGRKALAGWVKIAGVRWLRARLPTLSDPVDLTVLSEGRAAPTEIAKIFRSLSGEEIRPQITVSPDGTLSTMPFASTRPVGQASALLLLILAGPIIAI